MEAALEVIGEGYPQVHALLGAMYCHQTFINPEPDMALLESAKEQFQKVLHLQPDYQLSEKLFSPRILNFFEQVRSVTQGSAMIPTATSTAQWSLCSFLIKSYRCATLWSILPRRPKLIK